MSVVDRASTVNVVVSHTAEAAGTAAGRTAADALAKVLAEQPRARVIFASAPSQEQMLRTLGQDPRIDWSRVTSLHMDDYLELDPAHPASFGTWLSDRLPTAARPGLNRIRQDVDPDGEVRRYSEVVAAGPIDLVCLGIGVNGHIAFNEPGDTDLTDPALVRKVALAATSRRQQVDEGLFPSIDQVPTHALTLTVPAMLAARTIVCTVLGETKAEAVASTLTGPVSAEVPASAVHTHSDVVVHLDAAAATELPQSLRSGGRP
ncbi:6-phosphogluconolactonase [Brachybacterium fresconis]|uniref:Glucosamine-6-phosphate deaminase n=1 Tax=Brachybacterium fresconis TaxID=173363 RepID=A0ABS4YR12_9MICO|nr:6-phosphogluconolactonase [Brachybacterium fresconis]MBP2411194.1 glucosamine-6-phosphate deaminase [Brachybacterium fresconis]